MISERSTYDSEVQCFLEESLFSIEKSSRLVILYLTNYLVFVFLFGGLSCQRGLEKGFFRCKVDLIDTCINSDEIEAFLSFMFINYYQNNVG